MQEVLIKNLELHLSKLIPQHNIAKAYRHAVLPPGKLFRPKLVVSLLKDYSGMMWEKELSNPEAPHSLLSSFVELHHAYTLVHDDLPCMDDDDMRRGKASVHKEFGEWRAVLVGDGLLNASYQLLAKINSPQLGQTLRFITWALGPKGLIQGQVLDLSEEMTLSFENLLLTHQYKTARLIQVSLVASYLLLPSQAPKYKTAKQLFRLGHGLGIVFQLLDDLTELADKKLSHHENAVNPWLTNNQACFQAVVQNLDKMNSILEQEKLENLQECLSEYFQKIKSILENNISTVEGHAKERNPEFNLAPMMSLLERIC